MRVSPLILACVVAASPLLAQRPADRAHVTKQPFANDGTPAQVAFPADLHLRNTGGNDRGPRNPRGEPGKGSGLCVWTSIENASNVQNDRGGQGLQKWMMHKPGGGTPSRVDSLLGLFAKEINEPSPDYVQIRSADLDVLRIAAATGRLACVTYAKSPTGRYGGGIIYHMVNLAAAGAGKGPDGKGWWAVVDNNYPGTWEWMSESQFSIAYRGGSGPWAIVLLRPSPPPSPQSQER